MGGSLYEISNELRNILNSAMESDGEITQEDYDKLMITRENLLQKAIEYCQAITLINYDVDACKCEKKRINANQQIKAHLVDRLKQRLLDAVTEFGQEKEGKNGTTYTLDAGTFKLFTKNLVKFVEDEYRANLLKNTVLDYFKELYINGVLTAEDSEDSVETMLGAVNAIAKAKFEDDLENGVVPSFTLFAWTDFTIDDLKALYLNFSFQLNVYDLIAYGGYISQAYSNTFGLNEVTSTVSPQDEAENITIGYNKTNTSLTIK